MGKTIVAALMAMAIVLAFSGRAQSEEGQKGGPAEGQGEHRHRHPILFILDHARDLGITDDQKAKLEELRDKVLKHIDKAQEGEKPEKPAGDPRQWLKEKLEKILTAEQMEKLEALRKQLREEHEKKAK